MPHSCHSLLLSLSLSSVCGQNYNGVIHTHCDCTLCTHDRIHCRRSKANSVQSASVGGRCLSACCCRSNHALWQNICIIYSQMQNKAKTSHVIAINLNTTHRWKCLASPFLSISLSYHTNACFRWGIISQWKMIASTNFIEITRSKCNAVAAHNSYELYCTWCGRIEKIWIKFEPLVL